EDWSRVKYCTKLGKPKWSKNWITLGLGILCLIQLIGLIILIVLLVSGQGPGAGSSSISASKITSGHVQPGELIFKDEFDTLDLNHWRHERYLTEDGFVLYGTSENNSYVEDGVLFI
ncbi:unnamed protein product, partial [Allacma fusca]